MNFEEYKACVRKWFDGEFTDIWHSMGFDGRVEKFNILEMINRAKVQIYIMATSDSPNFDTSILNAVRQAKRRNVKLHVALHHKVGPLPVLWQEIKSLSDTFHTRVPTELLKRHRETLIADSMMRIEIFTTNRSGIAHWDGITSRKAAQQYPQFEGFIERHFDVEPNTWSNAMAEYYHPQQTGIQEQTSATNGNIIKKQKEIKKIHQSHKHNIKTPSLISKNLPPIRTDNPHQK